MSLGRILLVLLLSPLLLSISAFALYTDPPIYNVTLHNLNLAPSLNDSYSPVIGVNGTIGMDFNGTDRNWVHISEHFDFPIIHASAKLLTIDPSVDNATSASASPKLLFAWGAFAEPLAIADYEHDDCNESQISSSVSRSAAINFSFRNARETVIVTDSNVVPVPDGILKEMESTSGNDTLAVQINATFVFRYDMDDRKAIVEGGCVDRPKAFFSSISVSDSANWTVEGNRTLFFLRAPILGEQWFRNNRFDTVIFSNSRIYKAKVSADGNQTEYFQLYNFNITNDSYGVWKIESIPVSSGSSYGASGYAISNNPAPLERDNLTYGYLYAFNYTYSGIGVHTLALDADGLFGDEHVFSRDILSRMLSYGGNTSELGTPADWPVTRKSASFSEDALRTVTLSLGLAGLLLAALLINRIVKK